MLVQDTEAVGSLRLAELALRQARRDAEYTREVIVRIVVRGFSIDALSSVRVELAELCAILMRGARGLRAKGYELLSGLILSFRELHDDGKMGVSRL